MINLIKPIDPDTPASLPTQGSVNNDLTMTVFDFMCGNSWEINSRRYFVRTGSFSETGSMCETALGLAGFVAHLVRLRIAPPTSGR